MQINVFLFIHSFLLSFAASRFPPVHVCFVFSCERLFLTSLLSAGNSGSGAPVSDEHTGAAHTQRAASAGLLQLHVRPPRRLALPPDDGCLQA